MQAVGSHVQLWRFFLFLACLPIINVVATYILLAVVWFFESQFFTTSNVLYFVIALKASHPSQYQCSTWHVGRRHLRHLDFY